MSESDGEPLQTEKVYDEDEEVEVKYEPLDSELIRESEILGYDSGCVTCQKVIKKITVHLTDHVGSSSNDVDRLTEPREYIVDPNYIIKIEPGDDGIMNDTQRPGTHDSSNSGQRQWKVLDFDSGQCSPDCEICKKYLRELREHLAISHPQLQFQPGCAVAPLTQRSTVLGPLKTVDIASPEAHRFQNFQLFREPAGEKNTHGSKDAKIKKRTTQTSQRAGYPEEAIAIQASSSKPVKKKSRPSSKRSGQNQNTVINPTAKKRRTRRAYDVNSDSESKSKESESEGRSSNEIHKEVESSKLNPTSAVTLGENGESSDFHEINFTDHVSHTGGNQYITHTGNVFIEMSKTAVEGESVMTIHGGRQPEMDRSGQEIYQQTDTGEKQSVIVPVGGRYGEMSRIPEKVGHNKEEPTNLGQIMSEPAKSVDPAGELPNLTHTVDKPSMTTRGVEIPARLTHSGGKRNPRRILEHQILKRPKPSESESTSTTPLDNSYNCKKCRKVFSTRGNLLYHHNVVHSDERFECSECGQSFVSRSTLTLHEKIHMVSNMVGNSATPTYTVTEPVTMPHEIGEPTSSICIDHKGGKETQNVGVSSEVTCCTDGKELSMAYSGRESEEIVHTGDNPAGETTIGDKPENVDLTAVYSRKSTKMAAGGGKLVKMIPAVGELTNLTHVGEELENPTSTIVNSPELTVPGQKPGVIVHVGGESTNMNRAGEISENISSTSGKLDEMSHTEERPEELASIVREPARTVQTVRLRKSANMLKHHILKTSESNSNSTTPLDNSYNRKKWRKLFSANNNLWYRNYVVYGNKRFECSECGQSFMTRNALTLHEKIHLLRNNLLVKNGGKELTEQVSHTCGNSTTFYASGEPLTKTLIIGKPTNSIRIDHEGGKETQISNSVGESNAPGHIGTHPGPVTTIGAKPEKMDRITVASGKSTNMAPGEGKLVSMIPVVQGLANTTHVREELDNTTSTVEKSAELAVIGRKSGVIVHAGEQSANMNRVGGRSGTMSRTGGNLDEMSHTEERPEELASIVVEPARTEETVRSDQWSGDMEIRDWKRDFRCDECGINFCSSVRLSYHKAHHALGTMHTCDDCGKGLETSHWLKRHKEIHMPNYPLECEKSGCTIRFKTQSDLITHSTTCGGEKLLRCDVCGMRYKFLDKLIAHMVIHDGENPFRCEICGERFKTLAKLDTHILGIHGGEDGKIHRCGFCGLTFKRKDQLTDHKVIHSENPPFKCHICQVSYRILAQLTRHIGNHNEWKPYNCEVDTCEESFKSLDAVISHMLIHTNKRPFKCDTCGRNFETSDQLTYHVQVHSRHVWRKCNICKETFATNSLWNAHLPNHNKYTCKICKETFTTLSLWTKHQENHNAFK